MPLRAGFEGKTFEGGSYRAGGERLAERVRWEVATGRFLSGRNCEDGAEGGEGQGSTVRTVGGGRKRVNGRSWIALGMNVCQLSLQRAAQFRLRADFKSLTSPRSRRTAGTKCGGEDASAGTLGFRPMRVK